MLALRAVSSVYVNNASSVVIPLPTGAVAGDTLILFASHGFAVTTPTGFTVLHSISQSNYQGGTYLKVLVAADITAGSFTVNFSGAFYGSVAAACLIGSVANVRFQAVTSNTGGAASRTLTSNALPLTGDLALFYGAGRANTAITSSQGPTLASNSSVNNSFILSGGNLAADGVETETWTFPTVPSGDYCIMLILTDTAIPTYADVAQMGVEVLDNTDANAQVSQIGVEVLDVNPANAQMALIGVEVLRAITSVLRRRPVFLSIGANDGPGTVYPAGALFIDGDPLLVDTDTVEFS